MRIAISGAYFVARASTSSLASLSFSTAAIADSAADAGATKVIIEAIEATTLSSLGLRLASIFADSTADTRIRIYVVITEVNADTFAHFDSTVVIAASTLAGLCLSA